jgi:hypothetical protein
MVRVLSRQIEWMMCDDDLEHVMAQGTQPLQHAGNLTAIHPTALEREGARRIESQNRDLCIGVEGFKVVGNVAPVALQPLEKTGIDVVQRDVVVARNDDLRGGEAA